MSRCCALKAEYRTATRIPVVLVSSLGSPLESLGCTIEPVPGRVYATEPDGSNVNEISHSGVVNSNPSSLTCIVECGGRQRDCGPRNIFAEAKKFPASESIF